MSTTHLMKAMESLGICKNCGFHVRPNEARAYRSGEVYHCICTVAERPTCVARVAVVVTPGADLVTVENTLRCELDWYIERLGDRDIRSDAMRRYVLSHRMLGVVKECGIALNGCCAIVRVPPGSKVDFRIASISLRYDTDSTAFACRVAPPDPCNPCGEVKLLTYDETTEIPKESWEAMAAVSARGFGAPDTAARQPQGAKPATAPALPARALALPAQQRGAPPLHGMPRRLD
jgi:hypothetical protein